MSDSAHLCDESDEATAVDCWLSLAAVKGHNNVKSLTKKTFIDPTAGKLTSNYAVLSYPLDSAKH